MNGNAETNNRILKCFGKAALKISESFNGIEVASANAVSTIAPIFQAVRPGIAQAVIKGVWLRYVVASAKSKLNSTYVTTASQPVVSVPTNVNGEVTRKAGHTAAFVHENRARAKVAVRKVVSSNLSITAGVSGQRNVSSSKQQGEM